LRQEDKVPEFARVVVPGIPHHIIQRGNRRQKTFFRESDYEAYLDFMGYASSMFGLSIWAYCLMPNHVHIIGEPGDENSLARSIGTLHRRYTRMINFRKKWRGYLWQGRFASFPMDEEYALKCARYIFLNPVRAKEEAEQIRGQSRTGFPAGSPKFVRKLEKIFGRKFRHGKPSRPAR
jgi:putative transposase